MRAGIDIGGTKTDAVLLGDEGELLQRVQLATGFGNSAVTNTALTAVVRLASLADVEVSSFSSVGIGIPGTVDPASGTVANAVNLGVRRLDLAARLAEQLGVVVQVENDVNAAALGAYDLLGSTGSMAFLNLGTGLAAGLVDRGRLVRGASGVAGEIGHVPVDPGGVVCACGQRGCLETMASGSAIARQWSPAGRMPAVEVFDAAAGGDPAAQAIRAKLAEGAASAVRLLVLAVDVETVVIGGGLSNLGTALLDHVHAVFRRWGDASPFVASLGLAARTRLVERGRPVAAIGAALVGSHAG